MVDPELPAQLPSDGIGTSPHRAQGESDGCEQVKKGVSGGDWPASYATRRPLAGFDRKHGPAGDGLHGNGG